MDHTIQDARQAELDRLYDADGRHDPHHPMHALYTGLVQEGLTPAAAAVLTAHQHGGLSAALQAVITQLSESVLGVPSISAAQLQLLAQELNTTEDTDHGNA